MSASSKGALEFTTISRELLEAMYGSPRARLVMTRFIEQHYMAKMNSQAYGMVFVSYMARELRIEETQPQNLPRPAITRLQSNNVPLKNEDYRIYMRAAFGCRDKILVTHDSDYGPGITAILRKHAGISVLSASDALALLTS